MKKLSFGALRTLYDDLHLYNLDLHYDLDGLNDYCHKDKINECLRRVFYQSKCNYLLSDIIFAQSVLLKGSNLYRNHTEIISWLRKLKLIMKAINPSALNHWASIWDKEIINKARKQFKDELENNVVPADYAEAYTAEYWLLCAKAGIYEPLNIER